MIADAAIEAGMPASRIIRFDELNDIVAELQSTLKEDDVVLVKGSHGLRMDRIVSALEEQE
jgi:UDP-N-acetylmuramoyl-tripeptide--D-alanyl-D-alanine ligase